MTFGTKGASDINASDDWAEQFKSRKTALVDADNYSKVLYTSADSSDHLF